MKAVLIMGSESDMPHAEKITSALSSLGVEFDQHVASAHKNPEKVLEIIRSIQKVKGLHLLLLPEGLTLYLVLPQQTQKSQPLPVLPFKTKQI